MTISTQGAWLVSSALLSAALLVINPGGAAAEEVERVRLDLNQDFTHRNVLRTRLQAGNSNALGCNSNNNSIDIFSFSTGDRSNDIVWDKLLFSALEGKCSSISLGSESLVLPTSQYIHCICVGDR